MLQQPQDKVTVVVRKGQIANESFNHDNLVFILFFSDFIPNIYAELVELEIDERTWMIQVFS